MTPALFMVELTVSDWEAAVAWYTAVLGLPLLLRADADRFALLQAGAARLAVKGGTPRPGDVLLTFEVQDLEAELARLAGRGVAPLDGIKASPEGYRRAKVVGPDGQVLVLFAWTRGEPGRPGGPVLS